MITKAKIGQWKPIKGPSFPEEEQRKDPHVVLITCTRTDLPHKFPKRKQKDGDNAAKQTQSKPRISTVQCKSSSTIDLGWHPIQQPRFPNSDSRPIKWNMRIKEPSFPTFSEDRIADICTEISTSSSEIEKDGNLKQNLVLYKDTASSTSPKVNTVKEQSPVSLVATSPSAAKVSTPVERAAQQLLAAKVSSPEVSQSTPAIKVSRPLAQVSQTTPAIKVTSPKKPKARDVAPPTPINKVASPVSQVVQPTPAATFTSPVFDTAQLTPADKHASPDMAQLTPAMKAASPVAQIVHFTPAAKFTSPLPQVAQPTPISKLASPVTHIAQLTPKNMMSSPLPQVAQPTPVKRFISPVAKVTQLTPAIKVASPVTQLSQPTSVIKASSPAAKVAQLTPAIKTVSPVTEITQLTPVIKVASPVNEITQLTPAIKVASPVNEVAQLSPAIKVASPSAPVQRTPAVKISSPPTAAQRNPTIIFFELERRVAQPTPALNAVSHVPQSTSSVEVVKTSDLIAHNLNDAYKHKSPKSMFGRFMSMLTGNPMFSIFSKTNSTGLIDDIAPRTTDLNSCNTIRESQDRSRLSAQISDAVNYSPPHSYFSNEDLFISGDIFVEPMISSPGTNELNTTVCKDQTSES